MSADSSTSNGGKSALFRVAKLLLKCHFLNPSEQCHCFVLQSPSLTDLCSDVILLPGRISWSDYFQSRGQSDRRCWCIMGNAVFMRQMTKVSSWWLSQRSHKLLFSFGVCIFPLYSTIYDKHLVIKLNCRLLFYWQFEVIKSLIHFCSCCKTKWKTCNLKISCESLFKQRWRFKISNKQYIMYVRAISFI